MHVKCLGNIFAKFSPSENNHVYSMFSLFNFVMFSFQQINSRLHKGDLTFLRCKYIFIYVIIELFMCALQSRDSSKFGA